MGGQRHAPAALPPEKTRYPLYRRLGGPQGRSGQVRKISPPSTEVPRVKRRQKEADHSQPRSADVKKERIYFQTSTTRKLGSASNRAFAGFQASAVRPMRSALFCEITTIWCITSQRSADIQPCLSFITGNTRIVIPALNLRETQDVGRFTRA